MILGPLNLSYTLGLKERGIIAAYGAGGKTTLLSRMAQELASAGGKVLLTTTTKILLPKDTPYVLCTFLDKALIKLEQLFNKHNIVVLGHSLLEGNKIKGIDISWVEEIKRREIASYILVEADGAAQKPIKGFAPYEPVFPSDAALLLPVLGMDAMGARLDSSDVHRPELLGKITKAAPGEFLGVHHINLYLKYAVQVGRNALPKARIIPIVNKMDVVNNFNIVKEISTGLAEEFGVDRIIFTTLKENFPVQYISTPSCPPFISCVILAAGFSKRMGIDKLTLPLKGKTMLEHSVANALGSGVEEVIIVTKPDGISVGALFGKNDRVKVVSNPFSYQGISSSLKKGLLSVNPLSQGIIFALGDQPFVTSEVFDALIGSYLQRLPLAVCPSFEGKRGNPVLLDRRTWPLLLKAQGDRGGSQIFSLLPQKEIYYLETSNPGVLRDIDTPEDYEEIQS